MAICEILSEASYAERNKVGAIMVKSGNIIAQSYNGTISGFDNRCEDETGNTKPEVCHAEANLITKVATSNNSSFGSSVYTTLAPCIECAKLLIQAGVMNVYYKNEYRLWDGIQLLKKANIYVEKISETSGAIELDNKKTVKPLSKGWNDTITEILKKHGNYMSSSEVTDYYIANQKLDLQPIDRQKLISTISSILNRYSKGEKILYGFVLKNKIKKYHVIDFQNSK